MSASYRSQAFPTRRPAPPRRSTAGWLAVIVFAVLAGVGVIGAVAAVAIYGSLSSNLQPVAGLTDLKLPQETVLLDRTGETELARFGEFKREVVTFEEIPPILLDATTAVEDKTFWENAGFDPAAIVAAALDSLRGDSRGASTITQQLVRARLLEDKLVQDPERTVERKLKEIIQSIRLTQEFPGDDGKRQIITAYLNLNYYGNQSYGVKAAAKSYFGKELADLTPGEAALLAALPQSPSNYDLVRNAESTCDVEVAEGAECPVESQHLILAPDTKIAQRRDTVLSLMADGRMPMSDGAVTDTELEAEKGKPVELARQAAPPLARSALRMGGAGRARAQDLWAGQPDLHAARGGRLPGHDDARPAAPGRGREVAPARDIRAAPQRSPPARRRSWASTNIRPGCATSRTRTCAMAPSSPSITRLARSSPMSDRRATTRHRRTRSSSRSSTS